jgi:hypothetical protein
MVSPTNPSVPKGQTEQFMAMGMYSDNSTKDLTDQVTWASSDASIATISNASGSQGLATAVEIGTSTISATFDGMTGSTHLNVTAQELNPIAARDNSQAGYYQYGVWTMTKGGFDGSYAVADPTKSGSAIAHWLVNVPAGTYDLWATWVGVASNASNASYAVYDGFNSLGTAVENQQLDPVDGRYGGVLWAKLGTFTVNKGRITVTLGASGANGDIVADAIAVVPTLSSSSMAAAMTSSAPMGMTPATGGMSAATTVQATPAPMGMTPATGGMVATATAETTSAPAIARVTVSPSMAPAAPISPAPASAPVLLTGALSLPVQQTTAVPSQATGAARPIASGPAPAQLTTPGTASPSPRPISVTYAAESAAATVPTGSVSGKAVLLSKQAHRQATRRPQVVHESLIEKLARERVYFRRSPGHHHAGQ